MPPRTIVIGDIHGCLTALEQLLSAIMPRPDDTLVTLGDYVDRGPDPAGVVSRLIELASQCRLIPLLGNHELMMARAASHEGERQFWLACGGESTVQSYGGDLQNVPQDHQVFFRHCRRYFENETHFFIHANYVHDLPLDEQPDEFAFWEHIDQDIPPPHVNGKIAVVGHTPQIDGAIHDLGHLILMDTFCFGGLWLSGLDLTHGVVWQSNQEGEIHTSSTGDAAAAD